MFEQVQLVRTFLRMAWLYRWVGIAATIVMCIAGWTVVQLLPDTYEVKAKVFLDSRSMLRPLLQGIAFQSGALSDSALLLSRTLLTRPNLEQVARRADLDLTAKTPEEFDKLIKDLVSKISISGTTGDNIYEVKFSDKKAKTAKLVVDELLNTFMEQSLGDARRDTAVTQKFLDEQISAYEKRLLEAEDRVKQFKQRNVAVMPGSQGGFFSRLEEAHNQLKGAELELQEAQNKRDQLKKQAATGMGGGGLFGSEEFSGGGDDTAPEVAVFDGKIQELNGRVDEVLLNYTEKHPDVIAMRKLIADLEKKKKDKIAELAKKAAEKPKDAVDPAASNNPFSQQLNLQAAEMDAAVAGLKTRVDEYKNRIKQLVQKVDTVPEVEAELSRLNRDYTINKTQYDQLLQRRELAHMAQEADQSEDDVKIKLIEPPVLPLLPTGPNRLLFATLVLLVGLAAGGGLAVLLSQLNPRIIDVPDLKILTGLPVLGVISMTSNIVHRQQRRFELMAFLGALSAVFVVYIGQVVLSFMGFDLHSKLSLVMGAIA